MNLLRKLGVDILSEKYSYADDPEYGHTSAQKIPDCWVATTCGYCSVGCGMFLGVKDGRAVSVRGNPSHPVNLGKLCPKGLSEHYTLEAPSRAKIPLLRKNGKLIPVSWGEALDTLVTKFRGTQEQYGRDSLGVISTGQLVTEEFYTLGKLVQLGFGTKNYDGNTTLCMASAVSGYKRSFGSDGPPGAYEDLQKADVILLIGANIADNHPILCQHLEANPGKTLIVADPRVTKTAMMADLFLPLKPRSDIALINGIIHILIQTGKIDREFIANHTRGFPELAKFVEKYTPEYVAEITGLSEDLILKTAYRYINAGHNPPVVLRRDGSMEWLKTSGAPVGMFPDSTYEEQVVELEAGDLMIAFTDGLIEAANQDGEEWGVQGLLKAAACGAQRTQDAGDLVNLIFSSMDDFSKEHQTDDATLAVVRVI